MAKPVAKHRQICFAGQGVAQTADGVFDAALLPVRIGVAEESLEAEDMEVLMTGDRRAVVEGDGLAAVGSGTGLRNWGSAWAKSAALPAGEGAPGIAEGEHLAPKPFHNSIDQMFHNKYKSATCGTRVALDE